MAWTDRGQGLNLALQDAGDLVEGIRKVARGTIQLGQMLTEYDESMRMRASKEAQLSLNQTLMSHDWKRLMDSPVPKIGAHRSTRCFRRFLPSHLLGTFSSFGLEALIGWGPSATGVRN